MNRPLPTLLALFFLAAASLGTVCGPPPPVRDVVVSPDASNGSLTFRTVGRASETPYTRDVWCDCAADCDSRAACESACGAPDATNDRTIRDPALLHADGDGRPGCEDTWRLPHTEYSPRVCVERGRGEACGGATVRTGATPPGIPRNDLGAWADEVILIAGQSNANGASYEAPLVLPDHLRDRAWGFVHYTSVPNLMRIKDPWFTHDPRYDRFTEPAPTEYSTQWPWFAREWLRARPSEHLLLVQTAVGAQCLHPDGGHPTPKWDPGDVDTPGDGGIVYEQMIEQLGRLASYPHSVGTVDAVFWDQGECDSQSGEVSAEEYQAALEDLFDAMVNDAAQITPSTPFYAAHVKDANAADEAINRGIDQALAARANFSAGPDRRTKRNTAVSWEYEDSHVQNVDLLGRCWYEVWRGGNPDCSGAL